MRFVCSRRQKSQVANGFTLVEMMVIAPIVILLIGSFIALIVNLTGEVLSSRGSNMLAYNVQDALNRIEEDVKLSTTYLAVNNITLTSTKQGYGGTTSTGSTTQFTNVDKSSSSGSYASIILNSLITKGNPMSSSSSLIYSNGSCAGNTPEGRAIAANIVYFVDSSNTLWRRVIMPSSYDGCGAGTPWQLPSCISGYSASLTFCKANDEKLIEGVSPSDFNFQYYLTASATTPDATASNVAKSDTERNTALQSTPTIGVSITARQTIAGRDITRSGSLRATRLDTNASSIGDSTPNTAALTAPNPSGVLSDGHVVTVTWPSVANAAWYEIYYQIKSNGAACDAATSGTWTVGSIFLDTNHRSFTINQGTHTDRVCVRVRAASNGAGYSSYGTTDTIIPLWAPLILQGGWTDYSTGYSSAAYTKTKAGLVMIKGLIKSSGTPVLGDTIAILPSDYVPTGQLIFGNTANSNIPGRVDILANGTIQFNTGSAGYFSLETIRYIPASTTAYTRTAPTLLNGWVNYSATGGFAQASYVQDSTGRVTIQGLVKNGTITDGTSIFALPAGLAPPQYLHVATRSSAFAHLGIATTGPGVYAKGTGTNGYISLNETYLPSATWTALPLLNSWVNYAGIYSTAQYAKTSDNVVQLKGLVKSGTNTVGLSVGKLPAGQLLCPARRTVYATANNALYSRVDIAADGNIIYYGSSNAWFSLDNISFIAEKNC